MAAPGRSPEPGDLRGRSRHVRGAQWLDSLPRRHHGEYTALRHQSNQPWRRGWAPEARWLGIGGLLAEPAGQLTHSAGMQEDPQAEWPLFQPAEFEDQLAGPVVQLADDVTDCRAHLGFANADAFH
jgi:hypothetical protein